MRFWLNCALIIVALAGVARAEDPPQKPYIGTRACGGTPLPAINDNVCIPIDLYDTPGQFYTEPSQWSDYIQGRLQGVLAPAVHSHAAATSSTAGFQSAADKAAIDNYLAIAPITSKREGAYGDGTWHSLASQGYTVPGAQVRWPYLTTDGTLAGTHLIQTSVDLDNYGIDWSAIQHGVNKAVALGSYEFFLSGLNHNLERPVSISSLRFTFSGNRSSSRLTPRDGSFSTTAGLIEVTNSGYRALTRPVVNGVIFEEPSRGVNYADPGGGGAGSLGIYTAIKINSWSTAALTNNLCNFMGTCIRLVNASNDVIFSNNKTWDTLRPVYFDAIAESTNKAHQGTTINSNQFMMHYKPSSGSGPVITSSGGFSINGLKLTDNEAENHAGWLYHTGVASEEVNFWDVSRNRTNNYHDADGVVKLTNIQFGWGNKFSGNLFYQYLTSAAAPAIFNIIGGSGSLRIDGTTTGHNTGCLVKYTPSNNSEYILNLIGNQFAAYGMGSDWGKLVCVSDLNYTNFLSIFTSGNYAYKGSGAPVIDPAQFATTDGNIRLSLTGEINRTYSTAGGLLPYDAHQIYVTGTTSNVLLPTQRWNMPTLNYRITNRATGTATVAVDIAPNSWIRDINGNNVSSLTIAPGASKSFYSVSSMPWYWQEELP
ncbi:hypothetical protein KI809_18745 [Geobacter pelophilus]|uniref:Uncharacterized protein n=1 Tax=Geoanaerobacter pelophilus TaxID=60036 RepID=A0AAW4LD50_9BACT|nr:hypothetical protein [Geoanaerobacter pelophilus]MBT0666351.1 hypothetical protein [Geoanaerobacter pelophilus]